MSFGKAFVLAMIFLVLGGFLGYIFSTDDFLKRTYSVSFFELKGEAKEKFRSAVSFVSNKLKKAKNYILEKTKKRAKEIQKNTEEKIQEKTKEIKLELFNRFKEGVNQKIDQLGKNLLEVETSLKKKTNNEVEFLKNLEIIKIVPVIKTKEVAYFYLNLKVDRLKVDWGDEVVEDLNMAEENSLISHQWEKPGDYLIKIETKQKTYFYPVKIIE